MNDNKNVYVGHRYVPKIFGEWDKQEAYEGLSIVTHQGASYTSKKRVPVGIDISNEEYWVVTGNYNAQIEEYRKDVTNTKKELLSNMEKNRIIIGKNDFTRPKLGINAYWGDFGTGGEPVWVATKEQIKGNLDQFKDMIDEISIVIHLSYRSATNDFIIIEDLNNLKYGIEYGRSIGIETVALKIHCHISNSDFKNYGEEKFFNFYNNTLTDLCNDFKKYNIKYFVPFNELNFLYKKDSEHVEKVKTIINNVKKLGYKTILTVAGQWDFNSLSNEMIGMLDAISVNLYPDISNKMERTTLLDSIAAWNSYVPFLEYLKTFEKPIIISEYGCVDNWQALNSTGGWSFDERYKSNGEAPYLCYRGFLESNIRHYIDNSWIWFYQDIPNQLKTSRILRAYKGGNL